MAKQGWGYMKNSCRKEISTFGIFNKLMVIIMFIIVGIAIGSSFSTYENMKIRLIEIYEENLNNRGDERVEAIDSFFNQKFNNLEFLANQPEVKGMDWTTQRNYILGKSKLLGFEHIFLMDKYGKCYYVETGIVKDQSRDGFSKDVLQNDKFITEPFMEYTQSRSIVTMTYSIYDKDGNKIGAICGAVNLAEINKKIEDFVLGEEGFGIVINKNGEYVAAKDMSLVHSKTNFYTECKKGGDDYDISLLREGKNGVGFIKLDNVKYCTSYKMLEDNSWTVIIAMPEKEVLEQANIYFRTQIINIIAIAILTIGIIIILYKWLNNEKRAKRDGLTKLANRYKYDIVSKRFDNNSKESLVVVCYDLNHFKKINDNFGHLAGDELLKCFSKILLSTMGKVGFVARIGGDEFVAILKNISKSELEKQLNLINNKIKEYNLKNKKIELSVAYGYAVKGKKTTCGIEELFKIADENMYKDKKIIIRNPLRNKV